MFHKKNHNRSTSSGNLSQVAAQGQGVQQGLQPVQTVQNQPIVQEHVRYNQVTEVQPVIHRQVEQVHVHHIEQHIMHSDPNSFNSAMNNIERPPLVQDHVNHRFITEIHPIHHGPSYQQEVGLQQMHGPLQPFQQTGFAPQQQQQQQPQQQPQQPQQQQFAVHAAPPAFAAGQYAPQAVPASAPGAGFGGAPEGKTGRVKHHIFHRPVVTQRSGDGRIL